MMTVHIMLRRLMICILLHILIAMFSSHSYEKSNSLLCPSANRQIYLSLSYDFCFGM